MKNKIFLFFLMSLFVSCDFINLEELSWDIFPGEYNAVIGVDEPVWIEFSIPLNKDKCGSLFQVKSYSGDSEGEISWQGSKIIFTPAGEWLPGRRYTMICQGEVESEDGRKFEVNILNSFFSQTDSAPPHLLVSSPPDGGDCDVTTPLIFVFSREMEPNSFKNGFSLSPSTENTIVWDPDETTVTITPPGKWSNLEKYTWKIDETVTDTAGISLFQSYSGCFMVQIDNTAPEILSVEPCLYSWPDFPNDGADLNDLGFKEVVKATFSKEISFDSFLNSFKIEPTVAGSIQNLSPTEFIFIPDDGYVMNQTYHLTINTGIEDINGNNMLTEYSEWFLPDIPTVIISSITLEQLPASIVISEADLPTDEIYGINLDGGENYTINIEFAGFSGFITDEEKASVSDAIICELVFPVNEQAINKLSSGWTTDHNHVARFTGFLESTVATTYYYRLKIPGGREGIRNSEGSFMEQDVEIYIKTNEAI